MHRFIFAVAVTLIAVGGGGLLGYIITRLDYRQKKEHDCITEYDEKVFADRIHEEGRLSEIFESVRDGDYSIERGAQKARMSVEDFKIEMNTWNLNGKVKMLEK